MTLEMILAFFFGGVIFIQVIIIIALIIFPFGIENTNNELVEYKS